MAPDPAISSDASLVVAIARFDDTALAEVYRRHAAAAFGLARRVLNGNEPASEEVVQDVFLRLWNDPERFDPERGSLRSFLLAQVHGRAIDLLRAEGARRRRERRDARAKSEAGPDVEREVWDLALAEHLRIAIADLPEIERRPIELAYFEGHTYREVAAMLEEAEGTVKGRIRSGLRRLHVRLSQMGILSEGTER